MTTCQCRSQWPSHRRRAAYPAIHLLQSLSRPALQIGDGRIKGSDCPTPYGRRPAMPASLFLRPSSQVLSGDGTALASSSSARSRRAQASSVSCRMGCGKRSDSVRSRAGCGSLRAALRAARVMSPSPSRSARTCSGASRCNLVSSCSVRGEVQRPDRIAASTSGASSSSVRWCANDVRSMPSRRATEVCNSPESTRPRMKRASSLRRKGRASQILGDLGVRSAGRSRITTGTSCRPACIAALSRLAPK